MPEYLAPGVYVEETSFRAKSIEGVGTSTTGFVGATRYGPTEGEPELLTSFSQFERIYGGIDPLRYNDADRTNYLAHAVRAFFNNGGSRLYVARAFSVPSTDTESEKVDVKTLIANAVVPAPIAEIEGAKAAANDATIKTIAALNAGRSSLLAAEQALLTSKLLAENQSSPWQDVIDAVDTQTARLSGIRANLDLAQGSVAEAYAAGINAAKQANTDVDTENRSPANILSSPISNAQAISVTAANTVQTFQSAARSIAEAAESLATTADAERKGATDKVVADSTGLINAVENLVNGRDNTANTITNTAQLAQTELAIARDKATVSWRARFPGEAGNITIAVSGRLGDNVLTETRSESPAERKLKVGLQSGDLVIIQQGNQIDTYSAVRNQGKWVFTSSVGNETRLVDLDSSTLVYPLQISLSATLPGKFAQVLDWNELTISMLPGRARNSITTLFSENIVNRQQSLETPLVFNVAADSEPAALADSLLNLSNKQRFVDEKLKEEVYLLSGGRDGIEPTVQSYEGIADNQTTIKSGLKSLEDLEEIAIVAAPGYSNDWGRREASIGSISQALISHCDRLRYRVAILDSPENVALSDVRKYRGLLDTTRAALYYPWITVVDPLTNQQINLPPSGFVAGIYARNDVEIGVHKAPANEVVRGAIALETTINKAQQDILNPLGINCIRAFENRGIRVWGARTISSDPEWKYLNIRRYFAYLEASIDKATQWSVFQPNGERLWDNVRRSIEGFLENEWREGHLAGSKIEQAFFVRCDRSTMTQNDLDNGRLICLVGVAPLYPAEFVIFRIGQWTADQR